MNTSPPSSSIMSASTSAKRFSKNCLRFFYPKVSTIHFVVDVYSRLSSFQLFFKPCKSSNFSSAPNFYARVFALPYATFILYSNSRNCVYSALTSPCTLSKYVGRSPNSARSVQSTSTF